MKNLVRIAGIANPISPFSPKDNVVQLCHALSAHTADILHCSRFPLAGDSLGSMKANRTFVRELEKAQETLQDFSTSHPAILVVGTVTLHQNIPVDTLSVLYKGEILGTVLPGEIKTFSCDNFSFTLPHLSLEDCFAHIPQLQQSNSALLLLSAYQPYRLGSSEKITQQLSTLALLTKMGISYVSGGLGDSSAQSLYLPFLCQVEPDQVLQQSQSFTFQPQQPYISICQDFDLDMICHQKKHLPSTTPLIPFSFPSMNKEIPLRTLSTNPFHQYFSKGDSNFLPHLFQMQSTSLALRLHNISCKKIILPVSGGLDSTLALLVSQQALQMLNLPASHLLAVTMPGFGTSQRTYENAKTLIESSGGTFLEIPIGPGVTQHLKDIHHENIQDVTYENAQARERTQIALDLANKHHGLVVGTGDLSEDALGFCTFGGDHLANFNVNVCLTKTMIREMIGYFIEKNYFPSCSTTLQSILDTPISPELLPTKNGKITQQTETILGDYILHDFFLFYLVHYNLPLDKICIYAQTAFSQDFSPEKIKEKFQLFCKKFFQSQFKRSTQPDSTDLTNITLSSHQYSFSSDIQITNFF